MGRAFEALALKSPEGDSLSVTRWREKGPSVLSRFLADLGRSLREIGYGSSLYQTRLSGRHPLQLLASPDDPTLGDRQKGQDILSGRLQYFNKIIPTNESFWQALSEEDDLFYRYGHQFEWLRDLAQVSDQTQAKLKAEAMLRRWLTLCEDWDALIWAPDILAPRLINWFAHAPLILSSRDSVYRSALLNIMARQARHLMRVWQDSPLGINRLYSAGALAIAGSLLPGGSAFLERGLKALVQESQFFILADGGPRSRNPHDALKALQILILVRSAFIEAGNENPHMVQMTIDRLAPFLRAMRHQDGQFAQFGGMSADMSFHADALLAASDAGGQATEKMTHTGYQRVQHGRALLIMDTGLAPQADLSHHSHASSGAFEFSHGRDRLIVNIGHTDANSPEGDLSFLLRGSSAHNMLIVDGRNVSKIQKDGTIGSGVSRVRLTREEQKDKTILRFSHDGYKNRFTLLHNRRLSLSRDGHILEGEEQLELEKPKKIVGKEILIRFHLAPSVKAALTPDGRAFLEAPSGRQWLLTSQNADIHIEESLYAPGHASLHSSKQIVLKPHKPLFCLWRLEILEAQSHQESRTRTE